MYRRDIYETARNSIAQNRKLLNHLISWMVRWLLYSLRNSEH